VQERADLPARTHHSQQRELAHHREWSLRRRDQPILGDVVEEYVEVVARFRSFGNGPTGEQDLGQLLRVEIAPRQCIPQSAECVTTTNQCHLSEVNRDRPPWGVRSQARSTWLRERDPPLRGARGRGRPVDSRTSRALSFPPRRLGRLAWRR